MISFVIPAYNEEAHVGRCIVAIHRAMAEVGQPYEIIVADDASTDTTAARAEAEGARVVRVAHRHIAATRNAGARVAQGHTLFFVDADTQVSAALVLEALAALQLGAAGGGCLPHFEGSVPGWWRPLQRVVEAGMRRLHLTGGACQFCKAAAFARAGGFSEEHFAAEDLVFAKALKRQGPFVVLRTPVLTSARHVRACLSLKGCWLLAKLLFRGPDAFRSRRGLEVWYQPPRVTSRS